MSVLPSRLSTEKVGVPQGEDIDLSLLEHISPIEWENVILYGQYVIDPEQIR